MGRLSGISVRCLFEQSTTVPKQTHCLGHSTSITHCPAFLVLWISEPVENNEAVFMEYILDPSTVKTNHPTGLCRLPTLVYIIVKKHLIHASALEILGIPLHLNFPALAVAIFLRFIRPGASHLAILVSTGFWCKYSVSHCRLQSQINGLRARCL